MRYINIISINKYDTVDPNEMAEQEESELPASHRHIKAETT